MKAIESLHRWYNSEENRYRILTEWQSMLLSKAMADILADSETSVFRTFVAKLMSIQNRLDNPYYTDGFPRDRLITAVDLFAIQTILRDRISRTRQKAVNLTSKQLCDRSQSV